MLDGDPTAKAMVDVLAGTFGVRERSDAVCFHEELLGAAIEHCDLYVGGHDVRT